jgi:L-ascorbate metabolism protein UlaG (beta-lactamase superfamily)
VGVGRRLRKFGATAIGEHGWWDRETASDLGFSVACTPARHFSGRTPWGRNRTLWCGWVLRAHGRAIYFAGDTALHPDFADIAKRFGPFDLVLMPIGAYEPQWLMRSVHMNPDEAVEAYGHIAAAHRERDAHPPAMLPIHWGTFKLSDEPFDEPPRRLHAAWSREGHDPDSLWLLQHGETRSV